MAEGGEGEDEIQFLRTVSAAPVWGRVSRGEGGWGRCSEESSRGGNRVHGRGGKGATGGAPPGLCFPLSSPCPRPAGVGVRVTAGFA